MLGLLELEAIGRRYLDMSVAGASAFRKAERLAGFDRDTAIQRLRRALPSIALLGVAVAVLVEWDLYIAGLAAVVGSLRISRSLRRSVPQAAASWLKGGNGEQAVGALLQRLEARGWRAIHDRRIPGSEANIDHIVVGPGGVFVIETKNYSSKVTVGRSTIFAGGQNQTKILKQAKGEALAAYRVIEPLIKPLGLRVRPVVCFIGVVRDQGARRVQGVEVVSSTELVRFLGTRPAVLDESQVATMSFMLGRLLDAA